MGEHAAEPVVVTKADPKRPWKAIVAGVVFAGGWATTALADNHVSTQEGIAGAVGLVLALAAVYGVRNPRVPA
jgi:hypothetical protein